MSLKKFLLGATLVAGPSGAALAEDGWENSSEYARPFDHKTIVTVSEGF